MHVYGRITHCMFMFVYLALCLCLYAWLYVYVRITECMFMFIYLTVCLCLYTFLYVYACLCECMEVSLYICDWILCRMKGLVFKNWKSLKIGSFHRLHQNTDQYYKYSFILFELTSPKRKRWQQLFRPWSFFKYFSRLQIFLEICIIYEVIVLLFHYVIFHFAII